MTLLRVEGPAPSVAARLASLRHELAEFGAAEALSGDAARGIWRGLADVSVFVRDRDRIVWRISVAPQAGPDVLAAAAQRLDVRGYYDWGGGLLWLAVAGADDGGAATVRAAVAAARGHATLIRAPAALRAQVPVFEPQPPALAALSRRVKESFDPKRVLNPGRMYREL
jgi:glycolate oxidase FAD binding subunit